MRVSCGQACGRSETRGLKATTLSALAERVSGDLPDLRTMFITPAMASEPYCAAAPSRRISMFSIAAAGIAFKSTPLDPRPTVLFAFTSALA